MVRYNDHIIVRRHGNDDMYNPFNKGDLQSNVVYDGECKIKLTSTSSITSNGVRANYVVCIPGIDLPHIEERDECTIAFGNEQHQYECVCVEYMVYERNAILHLILKKDGDTGEF